MISLPGYNLPFGLKQLFRSYLTPRSTSKSYVSEPKASADLKKSRFLIVSDDPFNSFVFGRSIEKWNGSADIAVSVAQALENLSTRNYRVVLMDIKKNDRSSIALHQSLLATINTINDTFAIALIDNITDDIKDELVKAGFSGVLDKEIEPAELSQKLSEIL